MNLGLVAGLGGITAKVGKLQADLTKLTPALAGQAEVALDFPPNPASYVGAIGVALNPIELASVVSPLNMVGASVDLSTDLVAELGFVDAQLTITKGIQSTINVGLAAAGVAGWAYSGPAPTMGSELERQTKTGFGSTAANAQIQAAIIATESFAAWQAFSKSIETGGTANAPASAETARLAFLGELSGREWNGGVAALAADIDLLVADFRGQKSGLEASAAIAAGLTLPDVNAVVNGGLNVFAELGIDGLMENMVNVSADISGALGGINSQVAALIDLSAEISGQLSAGGLMFWSYSGPAAGLGAALRAELLNGIPGGSGTRAPAYGLVLAGTPASMGVFGSIFKTS